MTLSDILEHQAQIVALCPTLLQSLRQLLSWGGAGGGRSLRCCSPRGWRVHLTHEHKSSCSQTKGTELLPDLKDKLTSRKSIFDQIITLFGTFKFQESLSSLEMNWKLILTKEHPGQKESGQDDGKCYHGNDHSICRMTDSTGSCIC